MSGVLVPGAAPFGLYLAGLGVAAAAMTAAWAVSLWRSDASVADSFWGVVIAGLGWFYAAAAPGDAGGAGPLVLLLASAWGIRLSAYLTWRNRGKPEDRRYRRMRERRGARFPAVSLVTVFLLQALLAWVVSAPLFQAVVGRGGPGGVGWGGAAVAVAGLVWEAVADWQLQRFRARRSDEDAVLREGLWRYSRHPNYFGEFVFWWGILLAVAGTEGFAWAAVSPLLMTGLLLRVSGVPLLEKDLRQRPAYRRYVERTSAFFPRPPSGPEGP